MNTNLQYTDDAAGQATSVLIPIENWSIQKTTYELPDKASYELSGQQKRTLEQRIEAHLDNPSETLSWEDVEYQLQDKLCTTL